MAVALASMAGAAGDARAQGLWEPLGPYGGTVQAIAVDPENPNVVYAGTRAGVWKSVNGGASWASRSEGLRSFWITALEIDPSASATVYAATNVGVHKSTDGGSSWKIVGPYSVNLALAPSRPQTVYADGMRSTDGGASWTSVLAAQVGALAVDPVDARVVYASTPTALLKTTDGGATWNPLPIREPWVGTIVVDHGNRERVLVTADGRIARSGDGGRSWTERAAPPGMSLHRLVQAPSAAGTFYASGRDLKAAGFARSTDGGVTWERLARIPGGTLTPVLAVDPKASSTFYAGTFGRGMWKTTNGGASFVERNEGLAAEPAIDVAFVPGSGTIAYVSIGYGGGYRTEDGGASWHPLAQAVSSAGEEIGVTALAVDGRATVYMAAGSHGSAPHIQRSDDGGRTWTPAGGGLPPDFWIRDLYADPRASGVVFASGRLGYPAQDGAIYKTVDAGSTWSRILSSPAPVGAVAFDPGTDTIAVALGEHDGVRDEEFLLSGDWGTTWETRARPPFPAGSLTFGPTPDTVYAGSAYSSGVAKSVDGGRGWTAVRVDPTNGGSDFRAIAVDPADANTVYAGATFGGLWSSRDGGATWTAATPGVRDADVRVIAFAPTPPVHPRRAAPSRPSLTPVYVGFGGGARGGLWRFSPAATPAPRNARRPVVIGRPRVGRLLTCRRGNWSNAATFETRWIRNARSIPNARNVRYRVRAADRGRLIQCRVTARGPGGSRNALSRAVRVRT